MDIEQKLLQNNFIRTPLYRYVLVFLITGAHLEDVPMRNQLNYQTWKKIKSLNDTLTEKIDKLRKEDSASYTDTIFTLNIGTYPPLYCKRLFQSSSFKF